MSTCQSLNLLCQTCMATFFFVVIMILKKCGKWKLKNKQEKKTLTTVIFFNIFNLTGITSQVIAYYSECHSVN